MTDSLLQVGLQVMTIGFMLGITCLFAFGLLMGTVRWIKDMLG